MTDHTTLPPEADPRIRQFLDAWIDARGDGTVPKKSGFDPMAVPRLLSSIYICEWHAEAGDFRCLLAGEDVNRAWGGSLSGKWFGDVIGPDDHPVMVDRWRQILTVPEVHYGLVSERMTQQHSYSAERLTVPLADRDGQAVYVMGLSLYRFGHVDMSRPALIPTDTVRIACADLSFSR